MSLEVDITCNGGISEGRKGEILNYERYFAQNPLLD